MWTPRTPAFMAGCVAADIRRRYPKPSATAVLVSGCRAGVRAGLHVPRCTSSGSHSSDRLEQISIVHERSACAGRFTTQSALAALKMAGFNSDDPRDAEQGEATLSDRRSDDAVLDLEVGRAGGGARSLALEVSSVTCRRGCADSDRSFRRAPGLVRRHGERTKAVLFDIDDTSRIERASLVGIGTSVGVR